jgi:hypothetical protein
MGVYLVKVQDVGYNHWVVRLTKEMVLCTRWPG